MKILFIYPDILYHRKDWTGYFYVGVASLSAILKREGYQTALLHITRRPLHRQEFLDRITAEKPDLIGFSSTSHMFALVRQMAGWLALSPWSVPVICGGIHPTIAPEEVISTPGIDMICRGEGEEPLLELCQKMSRGEPLETLQNIWLRKEGKIIRNPLRPPLKDLDVLPYPDRELFDYPSLLLERNGTALFMASRGCPYDCSYCCNHLLRKIHGSGKAVRFRSVGNVIGEIRQATQQFPFIRRLVFDDDILFMDRRWSAEFAERYPVEIGLPFTCNGRADLMDDRVARLLKKAGCEHIKFGLESGNEQISNEILNRGLSNDDIRRAFACCKKQGLSTESFNMLGVPHDTVATILDTIKLNAEIRPDRIQTSIFQPYEGTKLAVLCQKECLIKGNKIGIDIFTGSILELQGISRLQVLMLRDYFKLLVRTYQWINLLPKGLSASVTKLMDRLLSLKSTAWILNAAHAPADSLFQLLLVSRLKKLQARQKRTLGPASFTPSMASKQ